VKLRNSYHSSTIQRDMTRERKNPPAVQATHDVFNQSELLTDYNLFSADMSLRRSLEAMGVQDMDVMNNFGQACGSSTWMQHGEAAEKNKPVLRQFDVQGRRIDVVDYHPSYHSLMNHSIESGCSASGYIEHEKGSRDLPHAKRAALMYMANQLEPGHCCPVVMTAAAIPVLQAQMHDAFRPWTEALLTQAYDPSNMPITEKTGVTIGMSMTEKQGGSDVRANTTRAVPIDSRDQGMGCNYHITGHKWFTSAPMSDGFLTLAFTDRESNSPSCFLVPRWLPDGSRNAGFQVMRLKDKLADRANASSEVEYRQAFATMVGDEGKGVKQIIEMVTSTRLDCALGSAGGARKALQFAAYHADQRKAFGHVLLDQPLMRNLLTDLTIEAEAYTAAAMRMAELWDIRATQHTDNGYADDTVTAALRVGIATSKYYITKRQPQFVYECMEMFGGNGFVEDFPMARLFRQSPLNSIWEGSGNVICLDILRAAPALPSFMNDIHSLSSGQSNELNKFMDSLNKQIHLILDSTNHIERMVGARNLADRLGLALCASILVRNQSPYADAYIATRINGENTSFGSNYGGYIFDQKLLDIAVQEARAIK